MIRRGWISFGWMLVLLVVYLSVAPSLPRVSVEHADKYSHVLAYGTLMCWFAQAFPALPQRAHIAIDLVLLGVCLELVQRWSGTRSFEIADMIANTCGVALGWALAPPRTPNVLAALERRYGR